MKQHFKVPDAEQRRLAVGSLPGMPFRNRKALETLIPYFDPLPQPKESDWLWEHEEEGQTYDAYVGMMHNQVDAKRNVIYIKPLEKQIDAGFLEMLRAYSECFFYPLKVVIVKQTDILGEGVDCRTNEYTNKKQYNARHILQKLKKCLKPDAFCLIGVAFTDLYPKDEWNFVFGLASIRQRTGVFSFARYDPSFFEQHEYQPNFKRMFWRSAAVMTHEIGHMFGIRHCIYFNCLMNGSNHQQQSARKPLEYCPSCLRKLQHNIKFDILERYEKMLKFVSENQKGYKKEKRVGELETYLNMMVDQIKAKVQK